MVFVDNELGVNLQTGGEQEECSIHLYDSFFFGENDDIPMDCPGGNDCYCAPKVGL